MTYAIILFAVTYVLMLAFGKYRAYIALGSAAIFIVSGMLPVDQIFGAIDFNVLMMIAGTMGLVQLFIDSKMPSLLADMVMEKVPNVQMAAVALALFAGIISAFVDNVATVLMVAPIALEICKKLKTNPVPFIIAIAVSSNLQGAATLGIEPTLLYFGLLTGATLGGNCTPIGASANIAGIGILRKAGYEVKTKDFTRIGIPFTLAAVIPAYIYFWLLYA